LSRPPFPLEAKLSKRGHSRVFFVIPVKAGIQFSCHSRANGNPVRTGSPIRSASLSVEDDKKGWIPRQVRDDKKGWIPRLLSVIPAQAGIQSGLDPQSEALRFRLGITQRRDPQSNWKWYRAAGKCRTIRDKPAV